MRVVVSYPLYLLETFRGNSFNIGGVTALGRKKTFLHKCRQTEKPESDLLFSNNFFLNFCMGNLNLSDLALFNFIWLNILERMREQKQNRLHRLSINCISSQTKSLRLFWFCPIVLFNNKGIK